MNSVVNIKSQAGQLVVTSRQVAEDFEKEHSKVVRTIEGLFEGIAKNGDTPSNYFIMDSYENPQNKQKYIEYLLTRDGFGLLVMGFTGSKALEWKLKYIDAFNKMENKLRGQALNTQQLSPELQMFNSIFQSLAKSELEQKQNKKEIEETKEEIQAIREVVEIRPSETWRKDTNLILGKICKKLNDYQTPKEEVYKALNERGKINLKIRLENMKARLLLNGSSKSKVDKLNYLDVIGEDRKLVEIYTAIVKEMAIKYKVA